MRHLAFIFDALPTHTVAAAYLGPIETTGHGHFPGTISHDRSDASIFRTRSVRSASAAATLGSLVEWQPTPRAIPLRSSRRDNTVTRSYGSALSMGSDTLGYRLRMQDAMRRVPRSLDPIGQGSPRLRHAKQRGLASGVLKLGSDLEAVGGAPPVERNKFAGRHPLIPSTFFSRKSKDASLFRVPKKKLAGKFHCPS